MAKPAAKTGKKKVFKKKEKRIVPVGVAHIQATFNNTLISITDINHERRRVTLKTQCLSGDTVVIDGEAVVSVPRRTPK